MGPRRTIVRSGPQYKASHESERLFCFKAASQARLCKMTRSKKDNKERSDLLKGFG